MQEQEKPSPHDPHTERYTSFGFTYKENLFTIVGHHRLLDLLGADETIVHQAQISSNNYGEFLFITASRLKGETREVATFWGLGYHDRRDRYIFNEWNWYISSLRPKEDETLGKDELRQLLTDRKRELEQEARNHTQSTRGKFYENLADLTDDDAAATEMDDLGDALDFLDE